MAAGAFNNNDWPLRYDESLMQCLESVTAPMVSLEDSRVFEDVLQQVCYQTCRACRRFFTTTEVKNRVHAIRNRFNRFLTYIALPGVVFNPNTKRVTVGVNYPSNGEESFDQRSFRERGFPFYDTCDSVFRVKNAAPIDLGDDERVEPSYRIVLDYIFRHHPVDDYHDINWDAFQNSLDSGSDDEGSVITE